MDVRSSLILVAFTVFGFACTEYTVSPDPAPPTAESEKDPSDASAAPPVAPLPDRIRRGVCLAHSWQDGGRRGYGTEASVRTLDRLAELGVNSVSLTPFGWMEGLEDSTVEGVHTGDLPDGAETDDALRGVVEQARSHEMTVTLKPHIWIRNGEWRGDMEPTAGDGESAWETWWTSYRRFITHYARLAGDLEVESLVVGVELEPAIDAHPEAFQRTVDAVREQFDGKLVYAANWDADLSADVWRAVDAVGVQFYPPLSDEPSPSVETLEASLREKLAPWVETARETGRPLHLSEVGYRSTRGATRRPYAWPQDLEGSMRQPDEKLQARAYRALFTVASSTEPLRAVYLWKYHTASRDDRDDAIGFTPRAKPAERILRTAYGP